MRASKNNSGHGLKRKPLKQAMELKRGDLRLRRLTSGGEAVTTVEVYLTAATTALDFFSSAWITEDYFSKDVAEGD